MIWVLIVGSLTSSILSRSVLLMARNPEVYIEYQTLDLSPLRAAIEKIASMVGIAGFVASFFVLPWWQPIIVVIATSIAAVFGVEGRNCFVIRNASGFWGAVTIICALILIFAAISVD